MRGLKKVAWFVVTAIIVVLAGCAGTCGVVPNWVDWEGTDLEGNYLECNCGRAGGDSGAEEDSGVQEDSGLPFGFAWCVGGMAPHPGCYSYDLGTVDLSDDPLVLSFRFKDDEYSYRLSSGQRSELRAACGLE